MNASSQHPIGPGIGATSPATAPPFRSFSAPALRLAVLPALLGLLVACGGDGSTTETEPPPTPAVSGVAPMEGSSGTEVRLDGSGFDAGSAVFFGDLASPRVELDGSSLFALAPSGLTVDMTYDIRVLNSSDGLEAADTATGAFTAIAPGALRVNGVTKPVGLEGMTVIVEGAAFGDSLALSEGAVFFEAGDGSVLQATITDEANDWTDEFVVTSVPTGTADTSKVWVETALGVSDSVEFRILADGQFSPSNIEWTATTSLPAALQGLGAEFVPVEEGSSPANYVFVYGGADGTNTAQSVVYRNVVEQSGALSGAWTELSAMPVSRAYHATAAATAFTAALDTATTSAVLYALGGVDDSGSTVSSVHLARVAPDGSVSAWEEDRSLPAALHSADAAIFRGYLYLAGGADASNAAVATTYRAPVAEDGSLGSWEEMDPLPEAAAYGAFVNFGPFLYQIGGETGTSAPVTSTQTNTETAEVYFARLDLRTGGLSAAGWTATEAMSKIRSKHSTVFAGGALFTTSGIFAGTPGSSENTFAVLKSDGTLDPWQGATGAETIATELSKSLYNQAMVTFIDDDGNGHLLVLGGADIANEGTPSADVIYY